MQDILAINKIEKLLDIKLEHTVKLIPEKNNYTTENGCIIGISICKKNFSDLAYEYFKMLDILEELKQLETLFLLDNKIDNISPLRKLKQLTGIILSDNQINDITPLQDLEQLTWINLTSNQVNDVAPLQKLKQLDWLMLGYNEKIESIKSLRELEKLSYLDLVSNQIKDLTPLQELKRLTTLDVGYNQIKDVTPLQGLKQLTTLNLSKNQVKDLTPLQELKQLTTLNLSKNQVNDVMPLQGLKQLTTLNLSKNQVNDVMPLQGLKQLTILDLQGNHIRKLSFSFIKQFKDIFMKYDYLLKNEGIYLYDNSLEDPPVEIVKQGRDAVLRYFERKEKEIFTIIREAKLIFVGDGAAGKTSLKIRLIDPEKSLPKEYERTRGIDITDWKFEENFTAHIWDFGGQDVYYPVHRFFITENSIFVLLASTRNEQHNFDYWIPTIYQFGGNSPIIIGQTCHGGNRMPWNDLDTYANNSKFNIIRNSTSIFYPVNLKNNNEGLEEIKGDIVHQIKKLHHCSKEIPESWVKVRERLAQKEELCIHYSEFENICKNVNSKSFTQGVDYEDCCSFLHNIGSIFWYHQNNGLKEWVILKPEMAVEAVYKIIDDNEIINRSGHIFPEDFTRLWSDDKYKNYRSVLKEMLKEFKVAFSKKHNDDEYILPALLKSIPKEKEWSETPCITVEYEYKFMPRAIVNQLSAELSKYIYIDEKEEVWNNAVNLVYEENTKCQVKEDLSNKKIIIKASGKDARGLIMLVMDSLDMIALKYRGVEYEILIPCTCAECMKATEYITKHKYNNLLRRYRDKGRNTAHCDESGEDIPIHKLLYNVGLPFTASSTKEKGDSNLKKINIFLASSQELKDERKEFELFINRKNKNLVDLGVFLNLEIWEDFIDAMSKTRLQDEYNRVIKEADIFISLFFTKAGKFTEEEFETAYKQFKTKDKPYVYTYFKDSEVKTGEMKKEDLDSLFKFKNKLKELGHFPTEYTDINDLKYQFGSQLDKLMNKL